MVRFLAFASLGLVAALLGGCAPVPYCQPGPYSGPVVMPAMHPNPLLVASPDYQRIWETVVDVIDDEFRVQHEEPVRVYNDTITEGHLETYYEVGSTILEPWRHDSANAYEKLESTLQRIRRRVLAKVSPGQGGYWVEIRVEKELEDLPRPMNSTAGSATFRYDSSLTRVVNPDAPAKDASRWIPQGRDTALEQRFFDHLVARLAGFGNPVPLGSPTPAPSYSSEGNPPGPFDGRPRGLLAVRPSGAARTNGDPSRMGFEYCVCRAQSPDWDDDVAPAPPVPSGDLPWATISGRSFRTYWESDDPPVPGADLLDRDETCQMPSILSDNGSRGWGCRCHAFDGCGCLDRWWQSERTQEFLSDQYYDWRHMYSPSTLSMAILGLGGAAILANTQWDQKIQDWYGQYVRGATSDDMADFFKAFGKGWYAVPALVAASYLGPYCHSECGTVIGQWGDRCVRSYLVGAPLVLALQFGLGANQPDDNGHGSYWRPFHGDAAISGQAFIGSVPFIQASMLAEGFWTKAAIFGISSLTAWARVNDDSHYLSQSLLGWWFAVLACEAVDMTDNAKRTFVVTPLAMNDTVGIGLIYAR